MSTHVWLFSHYSDRTVHSEHGQSLITSFEIENWPSMPSTIAALKTKITWVRTRRPPCTPGETKTQRALASGIP